jgi:protein O-mannosyl-transferase
MRRRYRNPPANSSNRTNKADPGAAELPEVATGLPELAGKDWFFMAVLVAAVFLAYQGAWQGGFVWDDDTHLLNNPVLKPGGLKTVWVPGGFLNYWPITCTAYWLEAAAWGLNPLGFHLANIAIHCMNALLMWRVLVRLGLPGARFAAAVFALHPVNVESVAWIAQLKGLLSLMLGLVSMRFFLDHERLGGRWRYALSIAAFLLATLSKGMVITLPLVLLACDWWQRGRVTNRELLRVLPYLMIAAVMAGVEVWGQHSVGADASVRSDGLLSRTAIAGCAVWFYFGKLIWPLDLCWVYPRWTIDVGDPRSYLPSVLLAMVLGFAWYSRRNWGRPVVMLIVGYVALLLPALGFVNIYFMRYSLVADHYQYAATIVPCAAFAAAAVVLGGRLIRSPWIGFALGLALLAILGSLTWRQSRNYADAETLYRATIERNPDCWMAYNNLGNALASRGEFDEAAADCRRAVEIKRDFAEGHYNLGVALVGLGRIDDAMKEYQEALIILYEEALRISRKEALRINHQEALRLNHTYIVVLNKVAWLRATYPDAKFRNGPLAMKLAQEALDLAPEDPDTLNTLAAAYAEAGRFREATATARRALDLAKKQDQPALIESIQAKVPLYESGRPFHEVPR